jgi:hypothetical protein
VPSLKDAFDYLFTMTEDVEDLGDAIHLEELLNVFCEAQEYFVDTEVFPTHFLSAVCNPVLRWRVLGYWGDLPDAATLAAFHKSLLPMPPGAGIILRAASFPKAHLDRLCQLSDIVCVHAGEVGEAGLKGLTLSALVAKKRLRR